MKKILITLFIVALALVSIVPSAGAARLLQEEAVQWLCVNTKKGCPVPNDPMEPFEDHYAFSSQALNPGALVEAHPVCSPFPQCTDGLEVYYLIHINLSWGIGYSGYSDTTVTHRVTIYEHTGLTNDIVYDTPCGAGQAGACDYWLSGIITMEGEPSWGNGTLRVGAVALDSPDVAIRDATLQYDIWFSTMPFEQCGDEFTQLVFDEYEIDPTIETPQGPPDDDQIYSTLPGEWYRLSVDGGPWNSGTNDYDDTEFSWDGVNWHPLDEQPINCLELTDEGTILGVYYLQAESTTFYIRVEDAPGAFADNYNNPDPMVYYIGIGVYNTATCEDQYTYDDFEDVVGYTGVPGTDEDGVLANNAEIPLVVGEWYVLQWELNYWQDDGGPDQIDLEYWDDNANNWFDLAEGAAVVWCISSDGLDILIQAHSEELIIRVNNVTGTFASNTGTPYYTLYHVAFTRTSEGCEQQYQIGTLIEHRVVEADKSGGEVFASIVGGSIIHLDDALTPGAWYVLDTTDGPWWALAMNPNYRYDMAVSEDNGATWGQLEEWLTPVCNVPLDTLGHRRVIFQMPSAGVEFWKLRVDAASGWFANQGEMEWDLYGAVKLENTLPDGSCDYTYDLENPVDLGEVQGNDGVGVTLDGLNPGQIYAIKIVGEGYGWQESLLGETLYDMQISHNDGLQWYSLPYDYPSSLCHEAVGDDLFVYVQPGENYVYKLRVDSETFNNNTGEMGYVVYPAEPGQSIVNTCLDGWSLQIINEFDWLDVRDEGGEVLSADTARYEEFIALVPGRSYLVETPAGQGPWGSFDALSTQRWDTALSPDNGGTWEEISRDSVTVDCTDYNPVGHVWRAKFTVSEGEVWKIRVNDEAGAFANNTGNMAYKLYVLCEGMACTGSVPNDGDIPAVSIQGGGDVCQLALIRPSSVLEVGAWIQYLNLSVLRYMAWCPRHTNLLQTFMLKFREREPFATIQEMEQIGQEVQQEIEAYDWGENSASGESIYEMTDDGEFKTKVIDKIFGTSNERSIWEGGDVVDFDQTGLPASYYSCESAFVNAIPSGLRPGVCFASAYMIETSASFWFQLSIDIAAFFLAFTLTKNAVVDAVYLLTGVQLSTRVPRAEARKGLADAGEWDRTAREHQDERARDETAEALARALGGNYSRNDDGSYSRRR